MIDPESTIVPHRPPQQARGPAALLLVVLVLLLPVGYVISVGPACLLVEKQIISEDLLNVVYAPLGALMDWIPPIAHLVQWYIGLWTS